MRNSAVHYKLKVEQFCQAGLDAQLMTALTAVLLLLIFIRADKASQQPPDVFVFVFEKLLFSCSLAVRMYYFIFIHTAWVAILCHVTATTTTTYNTTNVELQLAGAASLGWMAGNDKTINPALELSPYSAHVMLSQSVSEMRVNQHAAEAALISS